MRTPNLIKTRIAELMRIRWENKAERRTKTRRKVTYGKG